MHILDTTYSDPMSISCRWNAHKDETGEGWLYEGYEKTISLLQDVVRLHGPFDGVMGFSQVRLAEG